MKKVYFSLLALVSLSITGLKAQVFFSDNFSSNNLPGWTVVNHAQGGGSNVSWIWSSNPTSAGQYAGTFNSPGASNGHIRIDSDNFGVDGISEYSTITSSAINCTGKAAVVLGFTEYYRKFYSDTGTVLVSNDSVNWTVVHTSSDGLLPNDGGNNPNVVSENISAIAANQATVYIRFSWVGAYDYYWFVDDVTLTLPDANDIASTEVQNVLSNGCQLTNAEVVKLKVTNNGLTAIDSFTAKYQTNGGAVISEKVILPASLAYGTSYTYTYTGTADYSAPSTYVIYAWAELANDTVHANDTAFGLAISAASSTVPYTMGFEVPNIGNEIGGFTWTNEDSNNDGFSWGLSTFSPNLGSVHFRNDWNDDGQTAANDWLFSPCLTLTNTKAYKLKFFTEVGSDNNGVYDEKLEVKTGTVNTSAGMTEMIQDYGTLSNDVYEEKIVAFKPTTAGTYYVGFHCYSDADKFFLDIDDVTIEELFKPSAAFVTNQSGLSVNVTDGSDDMITDWTWNWGDGSANSNGQTPAPHTYANQGTYEVCLYVTNLAGSDTLCKTITISGIEDVDVSNQISVYPNPTNHFLNVMMNQSVTTSARVDIINAVGQVVMSRTTGANSVEKFDLSHLAQGVYHVQITSEGLKAYKKFVYTK